MQNRTHEIINLYSEKNLTNKRIILDYWEMKPSRFNESQIIKANKEHEGGQKAGDIVRDLGINQVTFYKWK
jgi:hypothetical protein